MTYCLGMLLEAGLVLASDSRSNAGVDQVAKVCKLTLMPTSGDRVVTVQSAGNLATTQAVVTSLREAIGSGDARLDLQAARSMFDVATMVGDRLREILGKDERFVKPYGDAGASFLVGGQITGEAPRLFEIYTAGNFIEATNRSVFLQIGETKYGKPILDRALSVNSRLDEAAKLALLSFDATVRSNLSVGLPIDMLIYKTGSFHCEEVTLDDDDPYWTSLRKAYGEGLAALVSSLPLPPMEGDRPWTRRPAAR